MANTTRISVQVPPRRFRATRSSSRRRGRGTGPLAGSRVRRGPPAPAAAALPAAPGPAGSVETNRRRTALQPRRPARCRDCPSGRECQSCRAASPPSGSRLRAGDATVALRQRDVG
eukprot:2593393-Pyramimonas_sp.AAC.1